MERSFRTYGYDTYGYGYDCNQLRHTLYAREFGNLFLDPMLTDTDELMNVMQIDFLQPVYTLTFSNGLIACLVFMGIGTLLDVGFLLQTKDIGSAAVFVALVNAVAVWGLVPFA